MLEVEEQVAQTSQNNFFPVKQEFINEKESAINIPESQKIDTSYSVSNSISHQDIDLDANLPDDQLQDNEKEDPVEQDTLVYDPDVSQDEYYSTAIDVIADSMTTQMGKPDIEPFATDNVTIPNEKVGCVFATICLQQYLVSLALKLNKTSFTPCHTITGKGIVYVRPFNSKLPLRPVEVEFENNRCCLEVKNKSDSTVEFSYGHEMAYFDARSKGLVQIDNSKHFPLDQYLHGRVTPVILSPKPLAYDKPIDPTEMPRISTCTEMTTEDTNVPTQDDKYPWLDPDDK